MVHRVITTSHNDIVDINWLGRPVTHLAIFSSHYLSAIVESTVYSGMSLRSILFHIVQLNVHSFALIVILEVISVLRWLL